MTIQSIFSAIAPYKRIIFIALGLIAGLFILIFVFQWLAGVIEDWETEKDKKAVNAILQNVNSIKGNLANLQTNEALKELEVNIARNDLVNKQEATNTARSVTNERLLGVNRIELSNFSNTSLENARKAQCAYNPARCQ